MQLDQTVSLPLLRKWSRCLAQLLFAVGWTRMPCADSCSSNWHVALLASRIAARGPMQNNAFTRSRSVNRQLRFLRGSFYSDQVRLDFSMCCSIRLYVSCVCFITCRLHVCVCVCVCVCACACSVCCICVRACAVLVRACAAFVCTRVCMCMSRKRGLR